jgi:hypothetical protein
MKNILTFFSAILFSTLFYQKEIGLNLLLFTLLTIITTSIKHFKKIKNRNVLFKIIAYLITGCSIFFYNSSLAILANVLIFFTFIGSIAESKTSIYINWINGIYTTIVSFFSHYLDNSYEKENVKKKKIDYFHWFKIVGIPFLFIIIFINLYRNGNPVFDELIAKIDFSFINLQWILFTLLGYFLFNNISRPIKIEPATTYDLENGNELDKKNIKVLPMKKLKSENQLGIVLLSLLGLLIVFFIATDIIHLKNIHKMVATQLSEQVHNGVNALISSNLLAIVIILYFFRANLNFFKENNILKKLSFTWIILNLIVVLVTFIKNIEYITSFGFTYKRIGVLFFLTATSVGLITTYIKVSQIKNLLFLFRRNLQITFVIFIISTTVNWDKLITYYNINHAEKMDLNYLIELSNNNVLLLKKYSEKNTLNDKFNRRIKNKYNYYINTLKENTWQETTYDNLVFKK